MTNIHFENSNLPDIIELKNIHQIYDGKSVVIEDLSLLIEEKPGSGQIHSILGPSGCGKSTLLRYISGLQVPTKGDVFLYEKKRTSKDTVGMVFQTYSSYNWRSVLDNVCFPLELQGVPKKERIERAMQMIKLCDLEKHKDKYAISPILSGGQLQRVAIARSLVANSNILLMDEPFGALDIKTRLKMQDTLLNIQDTLKPTILFITHDISEAVYVSSDVYIMSTGPGRIVERVRIDIPKQRNRDVKRDSRFTQYVYYIEDKMMQLQN